MRPHPRDTFLNQFERLKSLTLQLATHHNHSEFKSVADVFLEYQKAFEQQNPRRICEIAQQFDNPNWIEQKAKALQIAQSFDTTLTSNIFPEDQCRSFVPFCRIQISGLGSNNQIQLMTALVNKELQQSAPNWIQESFNYIDQAQISIPEKIQALEHLLHKMLKTPCANCKELREKLHLCSGCMKVRYCSEECQAKNWAEHRKICRK
jgi:hypothetical protein